jgi:hypothetical protein
LRVTAEPFRVRACLIGSGRHSTVRRVRTAARISAGRRRPT